MPSLEECACGCGGRTTGKYVRGHRPVSEIKGKDYCACGCGEITGSGRKYVTGHQTEKPLTERLWSKVAVSDPNSCWDWQGGLNIGGYGQVNFRGRSMIASRVMWSFFNGEIPEGMCICHRCDRPQCCNPDHLFLGTPADNSQDRIEKGRPITNRRYTDEQIQEMRRLRDEGYTLGQISRRYGISFSYLSGVLNGKHRAH